jgi:hypothetical protein
LDEGIVARVVTTFLGLATSSRDLSKRFSAKNISLGIFFEPRHIFWESAEINAYRQVRHFILPRGVPRQLWKVNKYIMGHPSHSKK